MSNHEPDLRRSARWHWGPIWGLLIIGAFITLMTTAYLMWWGTEEGAPGGNAEVGPVDAIDGEVSGTRPAQPLSIDRDASPGPVGVAPDAPGADVVRPDSPD